MQLRISTLLLSFLCAFQLSGQEAEISFKIKNAGIYVDGIFDSIQVIQQFDPQELSSANFDVTIPVTTIDTGINARDRHLMKSKYFDVENYPEIRFQSTSLEQRETRYQLKGNLNIKETTLAVAIDFDLETKEGKLYYVGSLELDRRDYGVGKNHLILGDIVKIMIQVPVENPGI